MPVKVLPICETALTAARRASAFNVPAASQHALRITARSFALHWVEPKLVGEITYLTWTADGLLRNTVCVGLREDKPAA